MLFQELHFSLTEGLVSFACGETLKVQVKGNEFCFRLRQNRDGLMIFEGSCTQDGVSLCSKLEIDHLGNCRLSLQKRINSNNISVL
jgi:hypothetical protein